MIINEEVIENVLTRKEELEEDLKKRQKYLIKRSQILEETVYTSKYLLGEESNQLIGESGEKKTLSLQIREEFFRQQKNIQEEMIQIQRKQAVIERILICFEALPFTWKEILEKLWIEQQKWESVELSKSTISYRKRKAIKQILEWFHSDLTDLEIIQRGQGLTRGK